MHNHTKYILFFLGVVFCISAFAVPPQPNKKCDVLPKPINVVSVPDFSEGESCPNLPVSSESHQYQGTEDVAPIFKERETAEEIKNGARYPKSNELYVDLEPDFILTYEGIAEPSQEDEISANDVK